MILLNLPTAYMTFPHCTIWRIMFSGLVFFSRCGVPLAGFGDTGPVAATDAARPACSGAFGAADEAEANPDAPVNKATVIRAIVPHQRQCPGLRIVSPRTRCLAATAVPPRWRAHFQRKCTNSRPWFLESFSTR